MSENPCRKWNPSLTRYLVREIGVSFFLGTTTFLGIMLMFQMIRLSDFVVVHQVGFKDILRLSFFVMFSTLPFALPVAFLFAVIVGISRANSEGEILALQSSGIGLWQVFSPVGFFSLLATLLSLYASFYMVPACNRAFELLITKLGSERVISNLKPGVFVQGFYGMALFAEDVIPDKNELARVFVRDDREPNHPMVVTAALGVLRQGEDGRLTLRLSDGNIHLESADMSVLQKIGFRVYDINLDVTERGEAWRSYSLLSYNLPQLVDKLRETEPNPPEYRQFLAELHRRIAFPFACAVFAALGFSLGIGSQRGVQSTSILICLMVAVTYWISYIAANALAATGKIPPWFGVWFPNFLFLGFSYLFYRRYGMT